MIKAIVEAKKFLGAGRHWMALLVMTSVFSAATVIADEHDEETFDLATITCWDLTGVEDEAQVPALMMVLGYVAGLHDMKEHNGSEIGLALERVGLLCEANPDMYVASAIERVLLP